MQPSASNLEQNAFDLPSVIPCATKFCVCCATETPRLHKDYSSRGHFFTSAFQSKSSQWNPVPLSVQSGDWLRLNTSEKGVLVSNVLRQSLLDCGACHQRPRDFYQSNVFQLQLSSVLPLACFSKPFQHNLSENKMVVLQEPATSVAAPTSNSEPAFNLWTSDTFTLEGGNCHCAAVDDF